MPLIVINNDMDSKRRKNVSWSIKQNEPADKQLQNNLLCVKDDDSQAVVRKNEKSVTSALSYKRMALWLSNREYVK